MDLSEKIKLILSGKNLSPSIFADEIGIQRSSVSHILAGRNKPSLDIVQKIIKRFPDLGVNWILDDEELPAVSSELRSYQSDAERHPAIEKQPSASELQLSRQNGGENRDVHKNLSVEISEVKKERVVVKVMMFYSDGTFEEFKSIAK
jgi:transcriptional regulator with XRE-family HTH domain